VLDHLTAPATPATDDAGLCVDRREAYGESGTGVSLNETETDTEVEVEEEVGEEVGEDGEPVLGSERTAALAAGLSAELAREEAAAPAVASGPGGGAEQPGPDWSFWDDGMLPLFPLQPPRSGRELLADHVTAMVCCAAMDTAGAAPGLDWLDGPALLVDGVRAADLGPRVLTLVEDGDPEPLRDWLRHLGVRPEKPVRLV
jgi:hypothetical protein